MKRKIIAVAIGIALATTGLLFHNHTEAANRRDFDAKQIKHQQELKTLQDSNTKLQDKQKQLDTENQQLKQQKTDLEQQLQAKAAAKAQIAAAAVAVAQNTSNGASSAPRGSPGGSVVVVGGTGSCADEIAKYDWPQSQAHAVMMQESSGFAGRLNDNPATGDYSVGCFQINLYGANAKSRPPEAWLKDAANNVSYAYGLWTSAGRTFCTSGGWLNTCRITGLL